MAKLSRLAPRYLPIKGKGKFTCQRQCHLELYSILRYLIKITVDVEIESCNQ